MTETLFAWVASAGLPVIAASAFLSCLLVPIPTFAVMLAGGAFAASGDLVLWQVVLAAWAAAVAGDLTGYHLGRHGGHPALLALAARLGKPGLAARAEDLAARHGGWGVFLTRWLLSPLGPWVTLAAGAARYDRRRFLIWDMAGEAIWVIAYTGLGWAFGTQLDALVETAGNWGGMITSAGLAAVAGVLLLRSRRA